MSQSLIGEIWAYLKIRKKWWLIPIIVLFVLTALLSPFIYALG